MNFPKNGLLVQFVLTLAFDRAVLLDNITLSIVVLATRIGTLVFLKKGLVFEAICFKAKVLKTFKISNNV